MSLIINPFALAVSVPPLTITWAGKSGATESPTGKLNKTAADGWGNAGAVSAETMAADCRLTIYREEYVTAAFFVGIGVDSSCNNFNTVDRAGFFNFAVNPCDLYENGSNVSTVPPNNPNPIMIVIERISTTYTYYYKNYTIGSRPLGNDAGRTQQRQVTGGSSATLYVNVALFHQTSGIIDAANLTWESI